jgi:hypothetical protein
VALEGGSLKRARLLKTKLKGADLREVDLSQGWLEDLAVGGERWGGANLSFSRWRRVDGAGLKLGAALLNGADLAECQLPGAELQGADLRQAVLKGVDLSGARLGGARWEGASLDAVDLSRAELQGTRWEGATLAEGAVVWRGAGYDKQTAWPEGFDAKAAGAVEASAPKGGEVPPKGGKEASGSKGEGPGSKGEAKKDKGGKEAPGPKGSPTKAGGPPSRL